MTLNKDQWIDFKITLVQTLVEAVRASTYQQGLSNSFELFTCDFQEASDCLKYIQWINFHFILYVSLAKL